MQKNKPNGIFCLGDFSCLDVLRDRSQIPMVGVTGRAPVWPGTLKLPGAAV